VRKRSSLCRSASTARLRFGQIEDKANTLTCIFPEHRPADQHRHAASVFPQVLFLEWLGSPDPLELRHGTRVAVAPFRRCQRCPVQATRGEILPVVSHYTEKLVIGLKNAPLDFPDDDADDVGVDQVADLLVARQEIAVERNVLCDRFPPADRFEPSERQRHPCQDCDNDHGGRDQPGFASFERLGAPVQIDAQEALVVHHLVDLHSYLVQAADHRHRGRPGVGADRFDDFIDLAQLCSNGHRQMTGTMALQWIARYQSLKRLRVPSYDFVGDAIGLEVMRIERQQIAAPLRLHVGDDRLQPIQRLEHLAVALLLQICRLSLLPISQAENPGRDDHDHKRSDHQRQRTSKPPRGLAQRD